MINNERIIEYLFDKETKIEDLSKFLKLDSSMIYSWKNGKYFPSTQNLIKMSEYFDCSVEFLLSRTEEMGKGKVKNVCSFDERLKSVMRQNHISTYKITRKDNLFSSSCLTRWFVNKTLPSPDMLIKLADYFGVTIDYLLGRE